MSEQPGYLESLMHMFEQWQQEMILSHDACFEVAIVSSQRQKVIPSTTKGLSEEMPEV